MQLTHSDGRALALAGAHGHAAAVFRRSLPSSETTRINETNWIYAAPIGVEVIVWRLVPGVAKPGGDVPALTPAQLSAASEFGTEAMQAFDEAGAFPAEIVIAAAARMAGSFLLRSFGLPLAGLQPGSVVLSDQANAQGPRLIQILGGVLKHVGVNLDQAKVDANRDAAYRPQRSFLETQQLLEPQFAAIRDKYKLNYVEAADAVAAATAVLIKNCSKFLDPHTGFGLAVYGFIEGSKTAPAD